MASRKFGDFHFPEENIGLHDNLIATQKSQLKKSCNSNCDLLDLGFLPDLDAIMHVKNTSWVPRDDGDHHHIL